MVRKINEYTKYDNTIKPPEGGFIVVQSILT